MAPNLLAKYSQEVYIIGIAILLVVTLLALTAQAMGLIAWFGITGYLMFLTTQAGYVDRAIHFFQRRYYGEGQPDGWDDEGAASDEATAASGGSEEDSPSR